ncbi:U3 small nucleolar RNA-associated protein 12 [Ceratobasidium sp. AG-Ba]|nr:U3 small nucleolar RNA-associated protein 12 [Ceratobasidium sp. AG-Ba]
MRDSSSKKDKIKAAKPPTSRAVGTSALAQPSLSSPASRLSSTGSAVADHTVDGARVTALSWGTFSLVDGQSKSTKKRRKRKSIAEEPTEPTSSAVQLIALGLSDGSIALFSPTQGAVVRTLSNPSFTAAITSIAPHNDSSTHVWAASEDATIRCWHIPSATPRDVALLSGPAERFVSAAEGDRVASVWDANSGRMVASVPLDSDARHVILDWNCRIDFASSGILWQVLRKEGRRSNAADVVAAAFVPDQEGQIAIARLVGVKPVFDTIQYQNAVGDFLADVNLTHKSATAGLTADTNGVVPTKRYAEPQSLAIRSGAELAQDPSAPQAATAADLDVELAEITLNERNQTLAASSEKSTSTAQKRRHDSPEAEIGGSERLPGTMRFETCLAHGDTTLIRNTVLRLPPTLCVPLIQACVERLGRGARGEKGGGAGASAQRGTSLIRWVRAVLVVHSGFLMTIPDLVARLSSLHSTLAARLALQDRLLALNGRLDLVLSQIEIQSAPRTAVDDDVQVKKKKVRRKAAKYVEGESESEENMSVDEGEESEEDEGSVEEIGFGGEDDDEEDEEEDDEDEDDTDDDENGVKINGFIDDEAEEDYSEDEESSAEE